MKKEPEEETTIGQSFLEASIPQDTQLVPHVTEIGEVIYVGDGICKIKGLPSARIDDMIKINAKGEEISALVLGLTQDIIETVVLGEYDKISKGDIAKTTHKRVTVPVGEAVLGRVINPLGHPVDGKGELEVHKTSPVEVPAPQVNTREQINEQVRTGVLVVDSIIPVGKGQRELCIGDRKTGKTTLVTNIIKNQKGKDMYCIYVSIGGKKAKVKGIIESLEQAGAMAYTTVVLATADDPPSLNYIAPYAGCAIGEYYMRAGKDALVIYDDLSKQAKSYRQMSLLLKRSPGRDAYPGDIFFLHSRLLERAAKLSAELGGGSLTAIPCAETQSGDISEYITTNLMSITDGHIYVDTSLLHAGIVPAVDSGASVSRIGGSIQTKLLRKLSELAGSQLQRYNEVKSYENINTEITEETEREIKRGKRILEIFNQPSSVCYSLEEEVLLLYIVTQGKIDDMEIPDVKHMKREVVKAFKEETYAELWQKMGSNDHSVDDLAPELDKILTFDFLQALAKQDFKEVLDQQEKKELNKQGLDAPMDLNAKKSGLTPDGLQQSNAIAPEAAELQQTDAPGNTPDGQAPEKQATMQSEPTDPAPAVQEEAKGPIPASPPAPEPQPSASPSPQSDKKVEQATDTAPPIIDEERQESAGEIAKQEQEMKEEQVAHEAAKPAETPPSFAALMQKEQKLEIPPQIQGTSELLQAQPLPSTLKKEQTDTLRKVKRSSRKKKNFKYNDT